MKVEEKLTAPTSGNTDMKAYIYGYIFTSGSINPDNSSDGFTVSRLGTGEYKITFDTALPNSFYIVTATSFANASPEVITLANRNSGYFILKSWKVSDASPQDTEFQFVVYKK